MTPRERFLAALRRQPVDRVPIYDFLFQRPLFTELIGRTPASFNARDAMDLTVKLGLDGVWIPFGAFAGWTPESLGEHVYKDEWGTTFETNASSWPIDAPIAYPLPNRAALAGYTPPDAGAEGRLTEIETAVAMNRALGENAVAVFGGVGGPLTTTWMLVGYEDICLSLYDDPAFIEEVAQLAAADIEETPDFGAQVDTQCILGMAKIKGAVKALLDIDRVIGGDAVAHLSATSDLVS